MMMQALTECPNNQTQTQQKVAYITNRTFVHFLGGGGGFGPLQP